MATPHSVAPACRVYLFASDLPGSSLCLLVCLRVLLGGVILGFFGSGCSSGWLVWCPLPRSRFLLVVWAPLCLLPGFLAGCSWFLPGGRFPFCWLLSGAPGFQSFFSFSSAQISLSLGPSCSSLSPLGLFLVGACVCLGYLRSSGCASPSPDGIPVGIPSFLYGYLPVALSHLPGGVQLFCFPLAPFQSVLLVCPGRWLIFLALSSAFCQVIDRRLLSSLWFGWCFCYLPCGPAPGLSLACWLFHCFFSQDSSLCASWTLGFSVPLPIPSSWAPLSRFSSSAASSSPRYSRWRLDPAFLLLWCAPSYSLSRLVSCFRFLGWLFRALSRFRGFLS